jgi:carboxypeptidase Q
MRLKVIALLAALLPFCAHAQSSVSPETRNAVRQLVGDIMVDSKALEYDRQLADHIGPRLTGSDNYVHAVSWAVDQFKSLGLTKVHTEPFTMPALWEPDGPASTSPSKPSTRRKTSSAEPSSSSTSPASAINPPSVRSSKL